MLGDKKKSILILDTDVGTDDAFAFLFLKYYGLCPDYIIVTGGVPVTGSLLQNAAALTGTLGLSCPLVIGKEAEYSAEKNTFHGQDGLGGHSEAMFSRLSDGKDRMASALSVHDLWARISEAESIRYISIGPLTTLSYLLDQPGFKEKVTELDLMGGGLSAFNCTHDTEYNFSKNPDAVKKVLSCGCPVVLFPLDLTNRQTVSEKEIDALSKYGTYPDFIAFLRYNLSSNTFYNQIPAAVLHDAMPVLFILRPASFHTEDKRIACDAFGRTYEDPCGFPLRVALDAEPSLLKGALQEVFSHR